MKKKITVSTAITLIILTVALTISVTMLVAIRYFNRQVHSVSQRQAMYTHINEVDKKVREYYTDLDEEQLRRSITRGYIEGIGDPYAAFYTSAEYAVRQMTLSGYANDVGVDVAVNADGQLAVCRVESDSAADKAGIKVGDVISAVDNQLVSGSSAASVQAKLDSAEKVLLSVSRGGSSLAFDLSAYRYAVRSVQSQTIGKIGYVKVRGFYENTPVQFEAAVSNLIDEGVSGLVFDLRDNAGGNIEAMEKMLSFLMPIGQYASVKRADGTVSALSSTAGNQIGVSTVTLVNGKTAGEAELFAGVLKEFSLTTVVGEKTAGKGRFQEAFTLSSDGSSILLSVGEYQLMKGGSFEGVGIAPTVETVMNDEQKAQYPFMAVNVDPQIQIAIAQISETPGVNTANKTTAGTTSSTTAATTAAATTAATTAGK